MHRYAQIDLETGLVVSDSYLSGVIDYPHMIAIAGDFNLSNKKYINGEWVEYTPELIETEYEPTEQELIQAEILLALTKQ